MQLTHVIIIAVIAFLVVLCVIYFKEIKEYLKNKFKKKQNAKQEKPKEEKKQQYSVEDFKPIQKEVEDLERDSSLSELFLDDEFLFENNDENVLDNINSINEKPDIKAVSNAGYDSEFAEFNRIFNEKSRKQKKKTLNEQIKELPPEVKALLIDNVLKKRDDV